MARAASAALVFYVRTSDFQSVGLGVGHRLFAWLTDGKTVTLHFRLNQHRSNHSLNSC
jgi:hypothetical protein